MPPRSQRQRSRRNDRDEASPAQVGTSTIASPTINSPHAQVRETTDAAAPAEVPAIAAPAAAAGAHAPALPPQIANNSTAATSAPTAASQVPAPPTPAGNNSIAAVAAAAAPVDNNIVGAVLGHIAPLLQSTTTTVTKLQASVEELSARLPPAGQQHLTAQQRAAFPDEWQNLLNAEITRLSVVAGVPFQHHETTHAYGTVMGHSVELQTLQTAAERLRALTEHMDADEAQ